MDLMPAAIGLQMAITQQKATLGMLKANADAQAALVNMIAQVSESISASGRGSLVNISA